METIAEAGRQAPPIRSSLSIKSARPLRRAPDSVGRAGNSERGTNLIVTIASRQVVWPPTDASQSRPYPRRSAAPRRVRVRHLRSPRSIP